MECTHHHSQASQASCAKESDKSELSTTSKHSKGMGRGRKHTIPPHSQEARRLLLIVFHAQAYVYSGCNAQEHLPWISSAASLGSANGKGVSEFLQTSSHLPRKQQQKESGISTEQQNLEQTERSLRQSVSTAPSHIFWSYGSRRFLQCRTQLLPRAKSLSATSFPSWVLSSPTVTTLNCLVS